MKKFYLLLIFMFVFSLSACSSMEVIGEDSEDMVYISYEMYKGETIDIPIVDTFENRNQRELDHVDGNNLDLVSISYVDNFNLSITALESFNDKVVTIDRLVFKLPNQMLIINVDINLYDDKNHSIFEPPFAKSEYYRNDYGTCYFCHYRNSELRVEYIYDGVIGANDKVFDHNTVNIKTNYIFCGRFDTKNDVIINDFGFDSANGNLIIENKNKLYTKEKNNYDIDTFIEEPFSPFTLVNFKEDGINANAAILSITVKNNSEYTLIGTAFRFNVTIDGDTFAITRFMCFRFGQQNV